MQSTWDDFAGSSFPQEPRENADYDGRPLDPTTGCPWCLAPPDAFRVNDMGKTGCRVCYAVQPTHMEWYQRGEKVVELTRASEMFQERWRHLFA